MRIPLASSWIVNIWTHKNVAQKVIWHARGANFNGIFLHVDSELLLRFEFEKFMEILSESIVADGKFYSRNNLLPLNVVLGISAEWVPHIVEKLSRIEHFFYSFYLWSDDTAVASDSTSSTSATSYSLSTLQGKLYLPSVSRTKGTLTAAHVDPLEQSKRIISRDTINANASMFYNL